jgi:uncharacterized protein DUF3866
MPSFREGRVRSVVEERDDLVRAIVALPAGEVPATGWPSMLGPLSPGDRVVVNTTGIELGLGTGGEAFILWNLDGPGPANEFSGHIMKMRYTPWQTDVAAVEAQESSHHAELQSATSLDGMPVVACNLHSQIAAVASGIKAASDGVRVGYLMTDAAALPLAWSKLVRTLRAAGLVDATCTCGHAFGGDLEAVNVFSALMALRRVARCDAVVVSPGPGVVGTGTPLGFSGIEQGQVLDAVTALGGRAVACLRISFADERERQMGVSHHSLTALGVAAARPCTIAVPQLSAEQDRRVRSQLESAGLGERHDVQEADGDAGIRLLRDRAVEVTSMGRSLEETPELFLAGAAAGAIAASFL